MFDNKAIQQNSLVARNWWMLLFPISKRNVHITRRLNQAAGVWHEFQLARHFPEWDGLNFCSLDGDHKAEFFVFHKPCRRCAKAGGEHAIVRAGAAAALDVARHTDANFLPGFLAQLIRKLIGLGGIGALGCLCFALFFAQGGVLR